MAVKSYHLACIGESMVEIALRRDQTNMAQVGFGGDTLNSAVYLARLTRDSPIKIHYVTLLGDDPFGLEMHTNWQQEGIKCDHVEYLPGRETGLYSISVDKSGERSFNYWRAQAPVRELFEGNAGLQRLHGLGNMDALLFSGITLAVLYEQSRQRLLDLCRKMKSNGKTVIFDSNFRPRLWLGQDVKSAYEQAFQTASIALPSREDLAAVFEKTDTNWTQELEKYELSEIILKNGGGALSLFDDGQWQQQELEKIAAPVDTTAAGDSFNAGYIAARLKGKSCKAAAQEAHELACRVISHPGAIIPQEAML